MQQSVYQIFLFLFGLQVKRSFGLSSLQLTYFDEENEEVRDSSVNLSYSFDVNFDNTE